MLTRTRTGRRNERPEAAFTGTLGNWWWRESISLARKWDRRLTISQSLGRWGRRNALRSRRNLIGWGREKFPASSRSLGNSFTEGNLGNGNWCVRSLGVLWISLRLGRVFRGLEVPAFTGSFRSRRRFCGHWGRG